MESLALFTELTDVAKWAAIVGILSPVVISAIVRKAWSERTKSMVALGFFLAAATMTAYLNGVFNTEGILTSIFVVILAGHTSFASAWKPSGAADKIVEITTPSPVKVEPVEAVVEPEFIPDGGGRHRA